MQKGRERGVWGRGDQIRMGQTAAPHRQRLRRRREVAAAAERGRGAGAVPPGMSPGDGGGPGSAGIPAALPPSLRPLPLLPAGLRGQRGCPSFSLPGGMHMGGVPTRPRVGPALLGSRAPDPSRSSSMAGNSRLRWRRAFPEILVRAGAVNSIFLSLQSLPVSPVSPPPSLLLLSGVLDCSLPDPSAAP